MTVSVQGGVPPYQLIIIPVGVDNPEYRRIINQNITQSQTSMSVSLAYPQYTQFIAIMSDATGFGTGGVSVPTTVRMAHFLPNTSGITDCHFWHARHPLTRREQFLSMNSCKESFA
jgi:hypothetical protein